MAEAATLTIGQIVKKGSGYMVSVRGKNDATYREAPLSKEAYGLIMDWIALLLMSDYIFTSFGGQGIGPPGGPFLLCPCGVPSNSMPASLGYPISSRMTSAASWVHSSQQRTFARLKKHSGTSA